MKRRSFLKGLGAVAAAVGIGKLPEAQHRMGDLVSPPTTVFRAQAFVPISTELMEDHASTYLQIQYMLGDEHAKYQLRKLGLLVPNPPLSCRWPRPTLAQLRSERVQRNAWRHEDDDDD